MRARFSRSLLRGLVAGFASLLMLSGSAVAQDNSAATAAVFSTLIFFILGLALVAYLYMALALQTIATKTATPNAWLAWIPIANILLMLAVAKKPMWWFVLFLVPVANIVVAIIVWMGIAKARNKPDWLGIMMIVPVANLVVPGYLAWAD